MNDYKTSRTSKRRIKEKVDEISKYLDTIDDPKFSIVKFFENYLDKLIPGFNLEVVSNLQMLKEEGRAYPDKNVIKIPQRVYDGALNGYYNDLYTLCHECGHLYLHKLPNLSFFRIVGSKLQDKDSDIEWQADIFAQGMLKVLMKKVDRNKK